MTFPRGMRLYLKSHQPIKGLLISAGDGFARGN